MLSEREAIVVWLQIASSFEQEASLFRPVCIALASACRPLADRGALNCHSSSGSSRACPRAGVILRTSVRTDWGFSPGRMWNSITAGGSELPEVHSVLSPLDRRIPERLPGICPTEHVPHIDIIILKQ